MTEWPVFASMSVEDRNQLLRAGRRRRFDKGETILHYGDPADSLHLLAMGRVAVLVLTPQGDQAILTVLGPGKVFGELALIDKSGAPDSDHHSDPALRNDRDWEESIRAPSDPIPANRSVLAGLGGSHHRPALPASVGNAVRAYCAPGSTPVADLG
jgi:CRP-like cAMP-binding protein